MQQDRKRAPRGTSFGRWLPLGLLLLGLVLFFAFRLDRYFDFASLRQNRAALVAFVGENHALAALVFVLVYTAAVAFSIPAASLLTLVGGFLFGAVLGAVLVVVSATLGATVVFLAARTSLGTALAAKAGPFLKKTERGFQENALSYLLVLRLVPLFPFWLVNIVPALFGVPLPTYVIATFLGIIPGSIVYTLLGSNLGAVLDAGGKPQLGIIFEPRMLLALLGLAILALLPVLYKKRQARKG